MMDDDIKTHVTDPAAVEASPPATDAGAQCAECR